MAAKPVSKSPNITSPSLINSWPSLQQYITALVSSIISELRDHAYAILEKAADLVALTVRVTTAETNITTNASAIATLAANVVTSIASTVGAFTLNAASGLQISGHDIQLKQGSSSQFGAVKVDNSTITAAAGVITAVIPAVSLSSSFAALGADVALNNIANYFDGPSLTLGAGTWLVIGEVTTTNTAASNQDAKLWDGTTVISSAGTSVAANGYDIFALSGIITIGSSATVKISVKDRGTINGKIIFNVTGNSKDSHITAVKIA